VQSACVDLFIKPGVVRYFSNVRLPQRDVANLATYGSKD
jgi:hypothetical protein